VAGRIDFGIEPLDGEGQTHRGREA
jgi:hypothetical protein